jgi:ancient ubiquitous protein 1
MAAHQPASNNLEVMAAQVKEILPHVPLATIIRDLGILIINYSLKRPSLIFSLFTGRTNSIDVTVANLVEGVVPFVPEPIKTAENAPSASASSAAPSSSSTSQTKASPVMQMQVSSSTFGKSAQERCLSLQERKQRLIQEARRRYCEKHGLQLSDC